MIDRTPPDPRRGRFDRLASAMQVAMFAAAAAALVGLLAPDPYGAWAARSMVAVLVAAPLARVVWFVQRWFRRGDPRFAAVGAAVLGIVVLGGALAVI